MTLLKNPQNIWFVNTFFDNYLFFRPQQNKHSLFIKHNCFWDIESIFVSLNIYLEKTLKNIDPFNFSISFGTLCLHSKYFHVKRHLLF